MITLIGRLRNPERSEVCACDFTSPQDETKPMTTDFDNLPPETSEQRFDLDRQITMDCVKAVIRQLESFNEQFLSDNVAYPQIMVEPALEQLGLPVWERLKKRIDKFYGV